MRFRQLNVRAPICLLVLTACSGSIGGSALPDATADVAAAVGDGAAIRADASSPSDAATLADDASSPSDAATLADDASSPSDAATLADDASSPSDAATLADDASSPSDAAILADDASSPSDAAIVGDALPSAADATQVATTVVTYPPAGTADFPNPERGFFDQVDLVAGGDMSFVRGEGYTMAYAPVRLDAYRGSALPSSLLDALSAGLVDARSAGIKVILRFVYNDAMDADAPKAQILAHLTQLAPILAAHQGVIAVLEAGFIGAWGEWHDSTNGLDNATDRNEILSAILAALPSSRSTMVRTPMFKDDAFGGPLADVNAFDGSPASRVGHHNDCLLASDTDFGTYDSPINTWKAFVAQEGRYTPIGGETCAVNPPRSDCTSATAEMAALHWSFLNSLYHPGVLSGWVAQGCRDQIQRELGYRLELTSASFDTTVAPGGLLGLSVTLVNRGNAAMYNKRPLYITLDDPAMAQAALTTIDPRRWEPGVMANIHLQLRMPIGTSVGLHRLGLWLPDQDPALRSPNPEYYAVRIANSTWLSPYNVLTDSLRIDPNAPGPVDPSAHDFGVVP